MSSHSLRSKWQDSEKAVPVAIAVVLLFFGSVVVDEMLLWNGVDGAGTFLNDIAIAGLGGSTVWVLLTMQARRSEMVKARERMRMTIALNLQVRNAFSVMASAALLKDEADRLHGMDEAMLQLDRILGDLAPKDSEGKGRAVDSRLAANPSFPVSLQSNATRRS